MNRKVRYRGNEWSIMERRKRLRREGKGGNTRTQTGNKEEEDK